MYSIKTQKKYYFTVRKHVILFMSFLVLTGSYIFYINAQSLSTIQPSIIYFDIVQNNTSCHYFDGNDALPSAEDKNFVPRPNSIFFHETSCKGGLNSRQACVVESAARAHPKRQVYVLFSGPVSEFVFHGSSIAKLRRLANVRFARVHIADYARNTPLEDMIASQPFNKSIHPVEHASDILRQLTLYKWGGVYLDTDMLVIKSLTPLGHNWVGREDKDSVNAAAIAISMDHLGRNLVHAIINEVATTYRPEFWSHNGPGAITRVLHRMCNTSNVSEWSSNTCQGLEVYSPEYFYPLHFSSNRKYFIPGELENVENAYTHHFWNKITFDRKIEKDSPYEKMAQKYCPTIYEMYGEEFGS